MPTQTLQTLLVVLLAVLFLCLLLELDRFDDCSASLNDSRPGRRPLRPRTPDDCPYCRDSAATQVRWQIQLGTFEAYSQALRALGLTGHIQTAFVE